jgi:hypothetical protein
MVPACHASSADPLRLSDSGGSLVEAAYAAPGITVREKAMERLGTQMALSTRENGEVIKEMDKDSFSTLTEML